MKLIQRVLKLERRSYFEKHLTIVNSLLPIGLTDKEIQVLSVFMSLDKSLIEDDMFNTLARKKVRETLTLSPGGLGNHLKSMIKKTVIDKHAITNKLTVKAYLIPEDKVQGYQIKIVNVE